MFSRLVRPVRSSQLFRQQKAPFFSYGNIGIPVLRQKDPEHVHHTDPGHDAEVFQRPELVGKGNQHQDAVPNPVEQASGKERIEYMALLEGKDPYFGLMEPLDGTRKGTKTNPIIVKCPDSDRLIGCKGIVNEEGEGEHAIQWMVVTEDGHKYWEFGHNRCPECGSCFKVEHVELPYPTIS